MYGKSGKLFSWTGKTYISCARDFMASLNIMGHQLRVFLKPLNTIVL